MTPRKRKRPELLTLVSLATLAALALASALVYVRGDTLVGDICPFPFDVERNASTCSLAMGGLWVSLVIGVGSGALATALGLALASSARLVGGAYESWAMRFTDAFFSLPDVLVLLVVQYALQTAAGEATWYRDHSLALMTLSLAFVSWSAPARMLRDRLHTLEQAEFVTAARALGLTRRRILAVHLWPGLRTFVLIVFLQRVPAAVLAESTVSYVGIGDPNLLSLGRYLANSARQIEYVSPSEYVLPAWALLVVLITCTTLAARGIAARAIR